MIGICNTWSELNPCNSHFRTIAEHVRYGVLDAGGFPLEFPVSSLGEVTMRPTAMMFRNLAAMDVEEAIESPWDGQEAITLLADLDAGATGAMPGSGYPDGIGQIIDPYFARDRAVAMDAYQRWLPLINCENRQCGLLAAKALMREGGVIACETGRHPLTPLHPATRAGLIEVARRLDPLVLRWRC